MLFQASTFHFSIFLEQFYLIGIRIYEILLIYSVNMENLKQQLK